MVLSLVRIHAWRGLLVAAAVAVGSGDGSRSPLGLTPTVSAAVSATSMTNQPSGGSGCYTPQFTMTVAPLGGPTFLGILTGEIEGSVVITFSGEFKFTGMTFADDGTGEWQITSGLGDGPVAFDTAFDNRNQHADRPGSPAWLYENKGHHRAVDGVEKANFTYHGEFDASILVGVHEYQGVICL